MREISASKFKAECLGLMDEIAASGEEVVVTKKGKPVVRIGPHRKPSPSIFGLHRDEVAITGDIISPLDLEWEARR